MPPQGARVVIGGAGLSGATLARVHADAGHSVLVLERRDVVGGNCADAIDGNGIRVPLYGPHCFHTNDDDVWDFLGRFATWEPYEHRVIACVPAHAPLASWAPSHHDHHLPSLLERDTDDDDEGDEEGDEEGDGESWLPWQDGGAPAPASPSALTSPMLAMAPAVMTWEGRHVTFVPMPPCRPTINALFGTSLRTDAETEAWLARERRAPRHGGEPRNSEEVGLSRVGPRLYRMLFKNYSNKQWGRPLAEIGPHVLARIPCRANDDTRYFADAHQALPRDGYSALIGTMLDHPNIEVRCGVDFCAEQHAVAQDGVVRYFTGRVDGYYAARGAPRLQYRTVTFRAETRDVATPAATLFPATQVNFPVPWADYTRITEPKHLLRQEAADAVTTLLYEYAGDSVGMDDAFYPLDTEENRGLYARYKAMAGEEAGLTMVGRLAEYKYLNMDAAVANALAVARDHAARMSPTGRAAEIETGACPPTL